MWPEGSDKVFIPWHEGSVFVPPDNWFHQHFNLTEAPARYLALHSPYHFNLSAEAVKDPSRDQIEYVAEDASIRQRWRRRASAGWCSASRGSGSCGLSATVGRDSPRPGAPPHSS
jgi:hypothetical protein